MALETRRFRWSLKARETRLLIYLLVLLGVVAWKFMPRPWHPSLTLEVPHHIIYSTATRPQTEETAQAMGLLYSAYSNRLGSLSQFQPSHPKLRVKLFKDRAELRRVNPGLGWAEAFYRQPYCLAYFSTSRLTPDGLAVGRIDPNTYPVWWIDEIATSSDLAENLRNGGVIPLRCIISNHGGPSLNSHFNLYYLHWWTLTYFVFESPQHRERALALVQRGGGLDAFEELTGPVDTVQAEWHAYVRRLKAALAGRDLEFLKKPKGTTAWDGNR